MKAPIDALSAKLTEIEAQRIASRRAHVASIRKLRDSICEPLESGEWRSMPVNLKVVVILMAGMDKGRELVAFQEFTLPATLAANADPSAPHHDARLNVWLMPFFVKVINTRVVWRSAALLASKAGYAPDYQHKEYLRVGSGAAAGEAAAAVCTGLAVSQLVLKVPALRRLAQALAPKVGSGPSEAQMNGGLFHCELIASSAEGDVLRGRVADSCDPGNRATTKMVCEAALCLALDSCLAGGIAVWCSHLLPG